ncbi:MAG: alpha/beta hydrolase, partial [Pseudomonadota bacterium]
GPTIVLLHGIRDCAWGFHNVATRIAQRYPTIALDLRGHGDSEAPGAYSFALCAADLLAVQTNLALSTCVYVGHSLGGQVAAHYAALFPESVSKLVIVEGLGPLRAPNDAETQRIHDRGRIDALMALAAERRRLDDIHEATSRLRRNHPRLPARFARFLAEKSTRALPDGGLEWKWDPLIQSIWMTTTRELTELRWQQIRANTLIVTAAFGGDYWQRRGHYAELEAAAQEHEINRRIGLFQTSQRRHIENAGHMTHYDAPEALAEQIHTFIGE